MKTDDYARVSVSVSDGERLWTRDFYGANRDHWIPLAGFLPGRTNEITVSVHDHLGNQVTSPAVIFVTPPLPPNFPKMTLLESKPERMEPGYTLFRTLNLVGNRAYVVIVNHQGEVVWYTGRTSSFEARQLKNGNFLLPLPNALVEMDILGDQVGVLNLPATRRYHHEAYPTEHGTILYLSDASRLIPDFPTSSTNPNAPLRTTNVWYNPIYEISPDTGQLLNSWATLDMLAPKRLTYLTFTIRGARGWDIEHSNAVIHDPHDDSVIVSIRHQNAVVKFSRQSGQLKWILGPHEGWPPELQRYLLTPVGTPFEWNYAQHSPMVTPQGTLLLYDDGNFRATPFDPPVADTNNYTRAVEFAIDEERMEVRQVWEYGSNTPERFFTPTVGDADYLPRTGNILVTFGDIRFINGVRPSPIAPDARMVRIQEVTHEANPELLFDLAIYDFEHTNTNYRGVLVYRSTRIPDFYHVASVDESLTSLADMVRAAGVRNEFSLVASLSAAWDSFRRGNHISAANQLRAFQNKVLAQVERRDHKSAAEFYHLAEGIIAALSEEK